MKKVSIIMLIAVFIAASASIAAADSIQFMDTQLGEITVASFDWIPANSLAHQIAPITGANKPFTRFYQASLGSFLDINGDVIVNTGLGTDYEITIVTASGEAGTLFGGGALLISSFDGANPTNYVKIYYDTNPFTFANPLLGIGYEDGTLLMEGTVSSTSSSFLITSSIPVQFDQFPGIAFNDFPGFGTVEGNGSGPVISTINPATINSAYIKPSGSSVLTFTLNFNTSQIIPFNQQDPSKKFFNAVTNSFITPAYSGGYGGYSQVNGSNATCSPGPCDFQFQADANNSFLYTQSCSVDIEKLVRKYQTTDPFVDADECTDDDVPEIAVPGGAEYKLIVHNNGGVILENCTITDEQLGFTYDIQVTLDPDETMTLTGQDIAELLKPNRCEAVGQLPNTASITCDCANIPGKKVTDADDACVNCVTCCIDLEKEVSIQPFPNPDWRDADNCNDSDVPLAIAPHNAMFRLIVENCGSNKLTDVVITDTVLGIDHVTIADLEPGEKRILTGTDISELGYNENLCIDAGSFPNTAGVEAVCSDSAQTPVSDEDSACWKCQKDEGGCRMTGGHNTVTPDGSVYVVPGDSQIINTVKSGKKTTTFKYTVGGQVGASEAGCCTPGVDCAPGTGGYGEWQHSHHENNVLKFSFHAGTHSSPQDSYIQCIACSDPFWCTQARCAPFKQIFWEGTGVFQNPNPKNDAPFKLGSCTIDPVAGKTHSLHYYQAHVGDFGEVGNTGKQKTWDPNICHWTSGGVDADNVVLMLPQPPQEDPKFPKFFDKGGMLCEDCPDWYEIEIHCTANPSSPIIYRAAGYLTGGNHQIHPEVGSNCFDAFPKP